MMTQEEYLNRFEQIVAEMAILTRAKNADYAGVGDAFKNFRLCEHLGITDTARGILVRMTDKFQRISNLIDRAGAVHDEKIEDTLKDLAIYSIILLVFLSKAPGRPPLAPEIDAETLRGTEGMERTMVKLDDFLAK